MSITIKTHKTLWGRSGNRCAYPGCGQLLSEDGASGAVVIGEEAHIVARESTGPRGTSTLPTEERDSFDNLILLCPTHHTRVDGDPASYTVEALVEMKNAHEASVMAAEPPAVKQTRVAEETYAEYIDEWVQRVDLDHWNDWASFLMAAAQPALPQTQYRALDDLRYWLLGRVWPGVHPALEDALKNFQFVLVDLVSTFGSALEDDETEIVRTHLFYKIPEWNPSLYDQLLRDYKNHVALVENLAYELTRAANLLCDKVREVLDPRFRLGEGALLISTGLYSDFTYQVVRPEYRGGERDSSQPYPGLRLFPRTAAKRDFSVSPSDF